MNFDSAHERLTFFLDNNEPFQRALPGMRLEDLTEYLLTLKLSVFSDSQRFDLCNLSIELLAEFVSQINVKVLAKEIYDQHKGIY